LNIAPKSARTARAIGIPPERSDAGAEYYFGRVLGPARVSLSEIVRQSDLHKVTIY